MNTVVIIGRPTWACVVPFYNAKPLCFAHVSPMSLLVQYCFAVLPRYCHCSVPTLVLMIWFPRQ